MPGMFDDAADTGLLGGLVGLGQGFIKGQQDAEDRRFKRMEFEAKHKAEQTQKEREKQSKSFEQAEKLRDDWLKNHTTTTSQNVQEAYRRIQNAPNTAAGDMSLIYGINKIMDPGSTVREGEFANAQATTSAMGQLQGLYRRVMTGQRLTPEQRQDFLKTAAQLQSAQRTQQDQLDDQFRGLSGRYGINSDEVVLKIFEDPETGEQKVVPVPAQKPQVPQATGLVRPKARGGGLITKKSAVAPKSAKDIESMSKEDLEAYLGQ